MPVAAPPCPVEPWLAVVDCCSWRAFAAASSAVVRSFIADAVCWAEASALDSACTHALTSSGVGLMVSPVARLAGSTARSPLDAVAAVAVGTGLCEGPVLGDSEGDGLGVGVGGAEPLGVGVGVGVGVGSGSVTGRHVVTAACTRASKSSTARCTPEVSTPRAGAPDEDGDGVEPEPDPDAPVEALGVDPEPPPDDVDEDDEAADVVLLDPSSASSAAWAATRSAWATVTARSRSAVPMVASASPASTSSPTSTLTEVTVPAVRKAAVTWSTRSTDPDRSIDWVTDPVATVAVRSPVVAAPLGTASATR